MMNVNLVKCVGSGKSVSISTLKVIKNFGGTTLAEEGMTIIPTPDLFREEMEDNKEEVQIEDKEEEEETDLTPVHREVQI